ncbi:MAG: TetR/AcrR family transcriptional regulator [Caldisericia bacterium]|nr:TetR/AcrR family transcriptional regulator [Caldisericia bacterium]
MDTKQQILDAARKVISVKGFAGARISDIVSKAGLAQGTFYLYFKNKQDVVFQLAQQITTSQSERIALFEQIGPSMSRSEFIEKVYTVFDSYMVFFKENADIMRVLAGEVSNDPKQNKVFRDIIERVENAFIHFFETAQKSGFLKDFDYRSISQMAIMAVMQFFFSTITKAEDFPSSDKIREFVDMCLFGILKETNA